MSKREVTRRRFVAAAASVVGGIAIVPRHVLGQGQTPPSEVVTRAVIGTGGQGTNAHVLRNDRGKPPVTLAVCDVDKKHLEAALLKAGPSCEGYSDYRKVLERKDIDTIHIATPPHWHALISIDSMEAGKDVLCEKPMTTFIAEGQAIIAAAERTRRMFQIGTFGRFNMAKFRQLVASDRLGGPLTVRLNPKTGYNWKVKEWSGKTDLEPREVPPQLDYDTWLGPAPAKPYHPHRVHASFRGYWDYDGGGLTDMGQHYLDPVQYFLGKDEESPVEVEVDAPPAHPDAVGMWGEIRMTYADGTKLILTSNEWGQPAPDGAPWLEGSKGKVSKQERRGFGDAARYMEGLDKDAPAPPKLVKFEESVKTRQKPGGNELVSFRSCCLLHIANAAIRTGRKLKFDTKAMRFVGDDEANKLMAERVYRKPYTL